MAGTELAVLAAGLQARPNNRERRTRSRYSSPARLNLYNLYVLYKTPSTSSPAFPALYPLPMSERKTLYRVSIRQEDQDGHITWHGVLTTEDHEKANEALALLKGDPEARVKLTVIPPGKGD